MELLFGEVLGRDNTSVTIALNDQLVQYSGTVESTALKATADTPDHFAGMLKFDDSSAAGPKIDVEFDAPLLKAFAKAR